MDPFTLAFGAIGLASSIFGGIKQHNDVSRINAVYQQEAATSQNIYNIENQQNAVRQQAMEVSGRRQQLEVMRNAQRQRAMAVQAGVNQGAQFGSGMAGGVGEVTAEGTFGLQGINQNLLSGRQMFGLSNQISAQRLALSQEQSQIGMLSGQMGTDAGYSSLGGALMHSAPMLGSMAQFGLGKLGNGMGNMFFGGGSPSGYGV